MWELAAVPQRGSETEAQPLPAIRTGGGGGRMQCLGSQQQLVPATAAPGHLVSGCSPWSRHCGYCRCKSPLVLPEFCQPPQHRSSLWEHLPTPGPFPSAVTCGQVSCPLVPHAERWDASPRSAVFQGLLPPCHVGSPGVEW